jgi:hypothetical protein
MFRNSSEPGQIEHHTNFPRKSAATLAATLACASFMPSTAQGTLPTQGMFDSCDISKDLPQCETRVQRLGQAGFRLVVEGGALKGSVEEVKEFQQTSANAKVSNIWPLSNEGWWQNYNPDDNNMLSYYPSFAAACPDCKTNDQLLGSIVSTLKGRGTWGYYIADDAQIPGGNAAPYLPALRYFTAKIHEADPSAKTVISNWRPDNTGAQIGQFKDAADLVLQEEYPVSDNAPAIVANSLPELAKLRESVQYTSEAIARGRRPGLATGAIIQAWGKSDSLYDTSPEIFAAHSMRFPTSKQLSTIRDTTLEVGKPSTVFYYTYTQIAGWPAGQELPFWFNPTGSVAARRWQSVVSAAFKPWPAKNSRSVREPKKVKKAV